MKLGTGSESYAPLAQAIIGGLAVSLVFTVFVVPAAFVLVYERRVARMRAALILLSLGLASFGQIPKQLTLAEAERTALKNHPAIGAAEFTAQASHQRINQAEAARFPFVTTSLTAVGRRTTAGLPRVA